MKVIFKDTKFKMSVACYCDKIELKSLTDDEISIVAETAGDNVERSLHAALLKYRSELNEEETK